MHRPTDFRNRKPNQRRKRRRACIVGLIKRRPCLLPWRPRRGFVRSLIATRPRLDFPVNTPKTSPPGNLADWLMAIKAEICTSCNYLPCSLAITRCARLRRAAMYAKPIYICPRRFIRERARVCLKTPALKLSINFRDANAGPSPTRPESARRRFRPKYWLSAEVLSE